MNSNFAVSKIMKQNILKYLGYQVDSVVDERTNLLIDKALYEVEAISEFKYIYRRFEKPLPFMSHPAYLQYFQTEEISEAYLLVATTLGIQIDRYLQRLTLQDMAYAAIFDTAANVCLETKADEYEKSLEYKNLGFRFCPGYGGTPLTDNQEIARLIRADRIGISFLQSGLMVPLKSMVGIVKIGDAALKTCEGCVAQGSCGYRKRGTFCYSEH